MVSLDSIFPKRYAHFLLTTGHPLYFWSPLVEDSEEFSRNHWLQKWTQDDTTWSIFWFFNTYFCYSIMTNFTLCRRKHSWMKCVSIQPRLYCNKNEAPFLFRIGKCEWEREALCYLVGNSSIDVGFFCCDGVVEISVYSPCGYSDGSPRGSWHSQLSIMPPPQKKSESRDSKWGNGSLEGSLGWENSLRFLRPGQEVWLWNFQDGKGRRTSPKQTQQELSREKLI